MSILSIQSHVVYGYVGNKAAVYPLQSMGHDVWPVNTVQFSRHTGYPNWEGEISSEEHIKGLLKGIEDAGLINRCKAVISGYMGGHGTCIEVQKAVNRFKSQNNEIMYLCDPVIGNSNSYVATEIIEFFRSKLQADIITPNQFEAEMLSGIKIKDINDLKKIASHFHARQITVAVITGIEMSSIPQNKLGVFVATKLSQCLIVTEKYNPAPISGTGDLFSAVFLAKYLETKDAIAAARNATHLTGLAVKNSVDLKSEELLVPSVDYKESSEVYSNELIPLTGV